jgi:uncharacterized protein (TIGR03083 family)
MARLTYERHCAAVVSETTALREAVRGADLARRVPTCPDWTIGELAVHVGRAHRWVGTIIRTRADREVPDDGEHVPDYQPAGGAEHPDPQALDAWLAAGAESVAEALGEAGPDRPVWTWAAPHTCAFWARRMAMETLVHRADAALAAGRPYPTDPELAADALDEWFELLSDPEQAAQDEELAALLGNGQSLHLHATDVPGAEWLIVGGPRRVEFSRTHAKADVALRATLTDLLLTVQRRLPLDDGLAAGRLDVIGDRSLLDHWLASTAFG